MSFNFRTEEYYKRFIDLQEKLRKSEEERLKLEIKFNEMVRVTREEEQMHYRKLRAQYKRFLEEDRRRQDRNERIMRNLERIDCRIAMIVAKTERFKFLRHQYHTFLQRICEPKETETREPGMKETERPVENKGDIVQTYLENLSSNKLKEMLRKDDGARTRFPVNATDFSPKYNYPDLHTFNDDSESRPNYANSIADDIVNSLHSRKKDNDKRTFYQPKELNNNFPPGTTVSKNLESEYAKLERGDYVLPARNSSGIPTVVVEDRQDLITDETDSEDFSESDEILFKNGKKINKARFEKSEVGKTKLNDPYNEKLTNINAKSDQISNYSPIVQNNSLLQEIVTPHYPQSEHATGAKEQPKVNQSSTLPSIPQNVSLEKLTENQKIINGMERNDDIAHYIDDKTSNRQEFLPKQNVNIGRELPILETRNLPLREIDNTDRQQQQQQELQRAQQQQLLQEQQHQQQLQQEQDHQRQEQQQLQLQQEQQQQLKLQQEQYHQQQQQLQQEQQHQQQEQLQQEQHPQQHIESVLQGSNQNILHHPQTSSGKDEEKEHTLSTDEDQGEHFEVDVTKEKSEEDTKIFAKDEMFNHQEQHALELHSENNNEDQYNKKIADNRQDKELYNENDQIVQQHSDQPLQQYVDNVHPTEQYEGGSLNYDENAQLEEHFEDNSQFMSQQYEGQNLYGQQYDETGQPIDLYTDNTQPFQQYDEQGQPIQSYDQQYDDQNQYIQHYGEGAQYDEHGQLIPQYDEQGQLIQAYDDQGQLLQQYDEHGQLIQQQTYDENQQQYDENGQLIQQYDYSGYEQQNTYDQNQPQYDENGQVIQSGYETQQYVSQAYDENIDAVSGQETVDESQPYVENVDTVSDQQPQENIASDQHKDDVADDALQENNLEKNEEKIPVEDSKKTSNLMEMLDTDTESTKEDTKISRDSDFDFSNN